MTGYKPQSPEPPHTRRVLPWVLGLSALVGIALAVVLFLVSGSPLTAGPGGPAPSETESPSAPADDPASGAPTTDAPSTSSPTTDNPTTNSPTPDDPGTSSPAPGDPSDGPSSGPTPTDPPASASPASPGSPAKPSAPATSGGTVTTAPGVLAEEEATELITIAIAPQLEQSTTETELTDVLADIAIEGYAEELQAQWLELNSQGWSVTGAPTVATLEITSLEDASDPVTAEVLVCIDSSAVQIVDADGESVGDPDAAMARALHRYTMIQADDGSWRVSSHAFPDDPEC